MRLFNLYANKLIIPNITKYKPTSHLNNFGKARIKIPKIIANMGVAIFKLNKTILIYLQKLQIKEL
jgi:hypothetical protein